MTVWFGPGGVCDANEYGWTSPVADYLNEFRRVRAMGQLSTFSFVGPPADDHVLLAMLPADYARIQQTVNGCVVYGGVLHIRGSCQNPSWHSLKRWWTGDDRLSALYQGSSRMMYHLRGDRFLIRPNSHPSRREQYALTHRGEQVPQLISLRNDANPDIADLSRAILKELEDADPSIPTRIEVAELLMPNFATKADEFLRFAVRQGWPPSLHWVKPEDVIVKQWRGRMTQFVWGGNPQERAIEARSEYQRASTNQIGLTFEAKGKTNGKTICRVYAPSDPSDAASRMIPQVGVKCLVASAPLPVILVDKSWLWSVLRWTTKRVEGS